MDSFGDDVAALRDRMFGFALSLCHDRSVADDLVQDAVVKALAAQAQFRPGTNLRAWLFTIVRNLYLNRVRDAARHPDDEIDAEAIGAGPYGAPPLEDVVVERVEAARIHAALHALPEQWSAPLHLVAVEGLTYKEVAGVLDIPVGTVMSRLFRGRRRILELLRDTDER